MKIRQYSSLSKQDRLTARLSDYYFGHYGATREECLIKARENREALQKQKEIAKKVCNINN